MLQVTSMTCRYMKYNKMNSEYSKDTKGVKTHMDITIKYEFTSVIINVFSYIHDLQLETKSTGNCLFSSLRSVVEEVQRSPALKILSKNTNSLRACTYVLLSYNGNN